MNEQIPLLVITGPTATGKTALAIEMAKRLGGEIITADSMQIYRGMDIGTAKPTKTEMQGIPHHMIDILDVWEEFSVAEYCRMAHKIIKDVRGRGLLPILAGGTGLYIKSITENIKFANAQKNEDLRAKLQKLADEKGRDAVYETLCEKDGAAAKKINPNDLKRVIRALELVLQTGKSKAELDEKSKSVPKIYKNVILGLELERSILYNRINDRVEKMLEAGLEGEALKVIKTAGVGATSLQGIGYKEIGWYLSGRATLGEAAELLKRATRRYAKRQITWLKRAEEIYYIDAARDLREITEEALGYARARLGERI